MMKAHSASILFAFFLSVNCLGQTQTNLVRLYRGSIGDKHIEMSLTITGSKVTGTYSYDQFRQDLKLEGAFNTTGELELNETAPGSKKPTGKFSCKREPEGFEADIECEWSRVDGTRKAMVFLYEQHFRASKDLKIVPRIIEDRRNSISVSYPQLNGASPSVTAFNDLIASQVKAAIKEFQPESPQRGSFDTSYNVLLGSENTISIEMTEYSDTGGAHPNTRLWTINYDLKSNRPLKLEDLFKPKADYLPVIAEYVAQDINRRAEKMERDEARRNGRPVEKRDEPVMTSEQLPEIYAWALSPKGLAVYFDFPHVLAVFDKTVIPYDVIRELMRLDGPAGELIR